MEGFCRGCLIKYDDPLELIQYSEKSRRLFVYSTGLQVKRNDTFTFQLCKDCFLNMKSACKFKKQCRSSDKKFKSFIAAKGDAENADFCNFLRNNDDTLNFRFPNFPENSTPATQTDDDNESICASIRNFMTDILQGEEMPDTEARIIKEVIEEEADVMEDSLDSHWLQDDVSVDTEFRLDFSFSPFSTPHSIENDHCYTPRKSPAKPGDQPEPKKNIYTPTAIMDHSTEMVEKIINENKEINFFAYNHDTPKTNKDIIIDNEYIHEIDNKLLAIDSEIDNNNSININDDNSVNLYNMDTPNMNSSKMEVDNIINSESEIDIFPKPRKNTEKYYLSRDFVEMPVHMVINNENNNIVEEPKDNIDKNLEQALQNGMNDEFSLEDLLGPPTGFPRMLPPTPTITNILFGEKLDLESNSNASDLKTSQCIEKYENVEGNIQVLEELFDMKETMFNIDKEKQNKVKQSKVKQNKTKQDKAKQDNVKHYKAKPNKAKQDKAKQENAKPDKAKPDKAKQENAKQDKANQDKANQDKEKQDKEKQDKEKQDKEKQDKEKQDKAKQDKEIPVRPEKRRKATKKAIADTFDLDKYYCKKCDMQFTNIKTLSVHSDKVHYIRIKTRRPAEKRVCDKCGKEFTNRSNYWKHKKLHMNGKLTPRLLNLQDENTVLKCDICMVTFNNEKTMEMHMVTHTGSILKKEPDRKHLCNICGASFNFYNNMRIHRLRHDKQYSYKCDECDKGFFRKYDLDIHKRVHTGDMPFKCEYCPKTFARRNSLVAHIQTHIGPGYVCEHCNTKFAIKRYIVSHLKKSKKCSQIRDRVAEEENKKPKKKTKVSYLKGSQEKINRVMSQP